ncbi:MAG TPA: ZIP family metal transporter [Methanomicrobiales archaeon]|nr:ZIP family metal transporter [Methanomicrobiales archaeon]
MNWQIAGIALTVFLATFLGGLVVFRLKRTLPYLFAFAAGNLIGVSFFDIQPVLFQIGGGSGISMRWFMVIIVASFFFFNLLERYLVLYHTDSEDFHGHIMGPVGAGGLVVNSLLDGVAIGIAFQAGAAIGLIVGLAVIFHDITDGMNTVVIMLKNRQSTRNSMVFLLLDSIAPALGILLTVPLRLPEPFLAILLSIFAGEFLFIGAASLLPETYRYPPMKMVISMGLGILLILGLTLLV